MRYPRGAPSVLNLPSHSKKDIMVLNAPFSSVVAVNAFSQN